MDDLSGICTRQPQEGDVPGAACPDCQHPAGCHGEGYCPLCAIIATTEAITGKIGANVAAFAEEVAAPLARVLDGYARQLATIGPALDYALNPH